MVFGFFSRRTAAVPVAGSIDDQVTAPEDAPTAVRMEITESTQSESNRTESSTSETPAPSTSSNGTAIPVQRTQSKSAFAFWKEREQKLHSPAASVVAVATPPPPTPTPPPQELVTDPRPLYALVSSVPAQTLHSFCLAHLNPANFPPPPSASPKSRKRKTAASRGTHRRSQSGASNAPIAEEDECQSPKVDALSPETLTTLTHFFRTLVPPPEMHCVRCHKGYFELENTDTSCRVPHDDESAIVDRVKSGEATYETLWGCCGRTVEGDGDQGPPDGWCYEGQHTIDTRRARFREDSTLQDDKLSSCAKMRCFGPPMSRTDSDGESVEVVRTKRKRRKSMAVDGEQGEGDDAKSVTSEVKRRKRNTKKVQEEEDEEEEVKSVVSEPKKRRTRTRRAPISAEEVNTEDDMDVDEPQPSAPATPASPKRGRGKATTQPRSRSAKPRSKAGEASSSPAVASGSVAFVEIRRSSRSPVRPHPTPGSKLKQQLSLASLQEASSGKIAKPESSRSAKRKTHAAEEEEEEEETQKPAPPPAKTPKKRGRPRKALQEVVDSSVAAENEMITAV